MRIILRRVLSIVLSFLFLLFLPLTAYANGVELADKISEEREILQCICDIEQELYEAGTSVEEQENLTRSRYEALLQNADNDEDKNAITELMQTSEMLRKNYDNFQQESSIGLLDLSNPDEYYYSAIYAISLWFSAKGYVLAQELLLHSLTATVDSMYIPTNGTAQVSATIVCYLVSIDPKSKGTGEFADEGSVASRDCYYAIKKFSFEKISDNGGQIMFYDRYDFDASLGYSGLTAAAVNTAHMAQQLGYIHPYFPFIFVPY